MTTSGDHGNEPSILIKFERLLASHVERWSVELVLQYLFTSIHVVLAFATDLLIKLLYAFLVSYVGPLQPRVGGIKMIANEQDNLAVTL
jgi:hypothetical protein